MDDKKRQMIVFLGFMAMMVIVFIFVFVQNNAQPPQGPEVNVSTGNQTGIISDMIGGWEGLINDTQNAINVMT